MIGEGWLTLTASCGPRMQQITELEYAIDPSTGVDCGIAEACSVIFKSGTILGTITE